MEYLTSLYKIRKLVKPGSPWMYHGMTITKRTRLSGREEFIITSKNPKHGLHMDTVLQRIKDETGLVVGLVSMRDNVLELRLREI